MFPNSIVIQQCSAFHSQQAESQVCRTVKTEGGGRVKGERPNLHLQIPPPSGSASTPSQPSSAESPFPFPPDSASSSTFFPDGPMKTPGSAADARTDPFAKMPPQSPHPHSQPSTPFSQASSSPLQATSSGYPHSGPQGPPPPQGRPTSLGPLDMQPGVPGNLRRAQQVDPFFRPQQQGHMPQPQPQPVSQEPLCPPESPRSRATGLGDSPLFSPPHSTHYVDPLRNQQGVARQEYGSSPSSSAVPSSPAGVGQYRADMRAPSPRSSSTGRQDVGTGSPAGMLDPGDGLFKAPMTPRMPQGDGGSGLLPPNASPSHPSEGYRQSPSAPFSDPNAQPPLIPRPQSADSCSPLPQRMALPQQESHPRVPSSPQSQGSSQSPLTPGALSNDGFSVQSPATPRFQSPDPYSRPPSRPQSRDPFATLHKPPRPSSAVPDGSQSFRGSPHPNQQSPMPPCSPSMGDPLSGKPPGLPAYSRSPGVGPHQMSQQQVRIPFGEPQSSQAQLQQPQPVGSDFHPRMPLPPGAQDPTSVRPPDVSQVPAMQTSQDMPDMSVSQDPAFIGLGPEMDKNKQVYFYYH